MPECERCGEVNGKMATHHINRDKKDNSRDNLLTLCLSCHGHEHGIEGGGSNTQFDAVSEMSPTRFGYRLCKGFNMLNGNYED